MASLKISSVKVRCRNCGNEALADDFKLDTVKGIMVCPMCDNRSMRDKVKEDIEKNNISKKPDDWDEIDEYLEQKYKEKNRKEHIVEYEIIKGSKYYVKYTCKNCDYSFRYNTLKHWPRVCPSCAKDIEVINII
jgi:Zn finger protein HypA/HybF involved in hydrogenase expression